MYYINPVFNVRHLLKQKQENGAHFKISIFQKKGGT